MSASSGFNFNTAPTTSLPYGSPAAGQYQQGQQSGETFDHNAFIQMQQAAGDTHAAKKEAKRLKKNQKNHERKADIRARKQMELRGLAGAHAGLTMAQAEERDQEHEERREEQRAGRKGKKKAYRKKAKTSQQVATAEEAEDAEDDSEDKENAGEAEAGAGAEEGEEEDEMTRGFLDAFAEV